MAIGTFRKLIERKKENDELKEVNEPFSPKYEIPKLASIYEKVQPTLFTQVKGYNDFKIAAGVYVEGNISKALGVENKRRTLLEKILEARNKQHDAPRNMITNPPVQQKVLQAEEVNLRHLPIPTFYPQDKGSYITAGIILAKDEEYGLNASYHRMTPVSKKKLVGRIVKRDLWTYLQRVKRSGEPLEAALIIGAPPALAFAAATSPPIDVSELGIASAFMGKIDVTPAKTLDLNVPARSEIIIEGTFLSGETAKEGPFVDITGSYDRIRDQPIFNVKCITVRRDPIFHMIVPAGLEHKTLMGLPKEAEILKSVSEVSIVKDLNLTASGSGWLDVVISIEKKQKDEAINAGMAAITGHSSLKRVIIVDPDVNIHSMEEVQWAVITRAHPAHDYLIIPRARGSSLDQTGKKRGKIIIDATIKGEEREFRKERIPTTDKVEAFIKEEKNDRED